jgi:hypothetical protein
MVRIAASPNAGRRQTERIANFMFIVYTRFCIGPAKQLHFARLTVLAARTHPP